MYNYNKLISVLKRNLYFIIISCIVLILIAIKFIIKDKLLIILCCVLITVLLLSHIIHFIKFINNVLIPMKPILSKELEQSIIECEGCLFTENYIINMTAYWIIHYDDILLMNKQLSLENGGPLGGFCHRVYVVTKNGNYSFILYSPAHYKSNYETSKQAYQHIKNKNPNILIGSTKENKMLLEKRYNIKLPSNWKTKAKDKG